MFKNIKITSFMLIFIHNKSVADLLNKKLSFAVIADHTVHDILYSYRLWAGIAVVRMSIYTFTVSN